MHTSMVLRMDLSSMKDRILDLLFSIVPRLLQLNCKNFSLNYYQLFKTSSRSLSGLTLYGPKPWDSLEFRLLTVMGSMLVRFYIKIFIFRMKILLL